MAGMIALSSNNETNNTLWGKVGIPSRGLALQSAISKGLSYDVFVQIAELTRIDKKALAACLSIAPATLHRRAKTGQFTPDESDKLYRTIGVLVAATALFEGNQDEAVNWLLSDIQGLGEKRPLDMLSTSAGCDAVIDMIGQLEHGVFA
jgi:putative toxin-antitoxin system antitoxin component (TIGR02293 family)